MGLLTLNSFLSRVREDLESLGRPVGQPRRVGVMDEFDSCLSDIKTVATEIIEHASEQGESKTLEYLEDYLIDLTSLLYAAGSPHKVWRRWSALSAFSQALMNRYCSAALYAALGGEWTAIEQIPRVSTENTSFEVQVIWYLSGKCDRAPTLDNHNDPDACAWLSLVQSIPHLDHSQTESALVAIAEFWIGELGDTWDHYDREAYPAFHAPACAAAAIARHHGYTPMELSSTQYRFLEPGLATAEPNSLVPSIWNLLSPSE